MFFLLENGTLKEYSNGAFSWEETPAVGCLSIASFSERYRSFGFGKACVTACQSAKSRFHSSLEVYDNFTYGILYKMDLQNVRNPRKKMALFFRKNLFLIVDLDGSEAETEGLLRQAVETVGHNFTLERVVSAFLSHLILGSSDLLEEYENRIMETEKQLLDRGASPKISRQIFEMKNSLTIRRSYYEELIDIGETLLADENAVFGTENLRYLKVFTDKVQRLSTNTELLRENLVHLREAYQSSLDYSLNNTMRLFTVVTTVFLPLSLIVGWYGMNFAMPEFRWAFGYPAVIVLCAAVVIFCLWFFKKKHFF